MCEIMICLNECAVYDHAFTQRVIRFFELIFIKRVVNGAAIVTSIICILLLVGLDYVNSLLRKYVKKLPIHIPAQLIVVCMYIVSLTSAPEYPDKISPSSNIDWKSLP